MALKIRYERGNIAFSFDIKRCLIFCEHKRWHWKLGINVERLGLSLIKKVAKYFETKTVALEIRYLRGKITLLSDIQRCLIFCKHRQ